MECIKFEYQKKHIKNFINLYHTLYDKHENMQNDTELKEILTGKHLLCKYFKIHKFCIYSNKKIVGRFVITVYPNDSVAYLGFFECVNDDTVASFLFKNVEAFLKKEGFNKVIGPVDASFWIKYRLKINLFNKNPYTGEPYNKDYYLRLFEENGYKVCEHYTSSIYEKVEYDFINDVYSDRYKKFTGAGYTIISPSKGNWDKCVVEVYRMISELYKDFPMFKEISCEDFCEVFKDYKQIINFSMVKLAYYNNNAVGFFISVPNYGSMVYHADNPINILRILKCKKKPQEYVMLYMGVDSLHTGLGKALVQSVIDELKISGLTSIGALQRDGKITQTYVCEKIKDRYEYVLLEKTFCNR